MNDISKDYLREGIGFEYAGVKILVYNGEWKNGKRNGKGKSYKNDTIEYDGEWRDGQPYKYQLSKNDERRRDDECIQSVNKVIKITIKSICLVSIMMCSI